MGNKNIFWIFGILQSIILGTIIFLIFKSLNIISEVEVIGLDTQIVLSTLFPLFLLIVEYLIYSKDWLCRNPHLNNKTNLDIPVKVMH